MKHQKTIKYEPITRDHYLHGDLFWKIQNVKNICVSIIPKDAESIFFLILKEKIDFYFCMYQDGQG